MGDGIVMVVDGDQFDQALVRSAFRSVGSSAEVELVPEVAIAIRLLQTCPPPDLLVVDLVLGLESGLELIHWIRREAELSHLPVVVLSRSGSPYDIASAYDAGANAYLRKPQVGDFDEVVRAIDAFWLTAAVLPRPTLVPG